MASIFDSKNERKSGMETLIRGLNTLQKLKLWEKMH